MRPVYLALVTADWNIQSLAAKRSAEQIFEIRMVFELPTPPPRYPFADRTVVLATQAIANVVKSSFGPSGLDKMMVDDIGVSYWKHLSCKSELMGFRMSQ